MTCIAALAHKGKVYIGGDSAAVVSENYSLCVRSDPKVFGKGPFLFGCAGAPRVQQLIQFAFEPPSQRSDEDDRAFMVTRFMDALRACLREGGAVVKKDDLELNESEIIIGYRGRLYVVYADYQIGTPCDPFFAVGCGGQVALGSLWESVKLQPRRRVLSALEAAERFSSGVRGPFVVEVL